MRTKNSSKRFVLAGNWKQFGEYCQEKKIPRTAVRYISRAEDLRGLRDVEVVKWGTWWLHPTAINITNEQYSFKFVKEFTEE